MKDKKKISSIIQKTGSIVGLILIAYQITKGFSAIRNNLVENINFYFIIFSILISVSALFFQVFGWYKLNHYFGINLPIRNILFGYLFTFLPRYIPGSIWGYLTRSDWLVNSYQIPYQNSLFVSVLEMGAIFISNLALGSILFFLTSNQLIFLLIPIFLIIISIIMLKSFHTWSLIKKFIPIQFDNNINYGAWVIVFASFIISWIFYGIGLAYTISAFTNNYFFDISNIILIISINSISWLVGFLIIFIPAGLGIRETLLNQLMINILLISGNVSSVIAVVYRVVTLAAEIILLLIGYIISKKTHNRLFFHKSNN